MRIAMVAPLVEPVPPLSGGTERVVCGRTEELVRRGHGVTLFASGDSRTSAELVPVFPKGLRLDPEVRDQVASLIVELGLESQRAADFDLINSHVDSIGFPFARLALAPTLTTVRDRLDLPGVWLVSRAFPERPWSPPAWPEVRPCPA